MKFANLVPSWSQDIFIGSVIVVAVAGFIIFEIGYNTYDRRYFLSLFCLLLSGGMSLLSLHIFVLSTGGSIQSFFAYHYLYLPAVVGIAIPTPLYLILVSFFSAMSYFINLYYFTEQNKFLLSWKCTSCDPTEWYNIINSDWYHHAFLSFFLIQVVMLCIMWFLSRTRQVVGEDDQLNLFT